MVLTTIGFNSQAVLQALRSNQDANISHSATYYVYVGVSLQVLYAGKTPP